MRNPVTKRIPLFIADGQILEARELYRKSNMTLVFVISFNGLIFQY